MPQEGLGAWPFPHLRDGTAGHSDKPLTGHGFGKALGAYGDAQAEYFETEERGQERVRIAGCPEYAFNEYLRMGMEFGILGLLLSVAVIVLGTMMLCHSDSSFHHKSNCAYTTIIL